MKGILVGDMPECCEECSFLCRGVIITYSCEISCSKHIENIDVRPSWCPIHPLPERKDTWTVVYKLGEPITKELADKLIDFGFNECLNAITEEKNESDIDSSR